MYSLVIPVYNRALLIDSTLKSALNQSLAFDEIIVVDDGSTDEIASVLAKYSDRIKVIHTANRGVQQARNTGVDAARGDRVVFCDSDDLLDEDYLLVMSKWIECYPDIDVTYCNFSTFGDRPWFSDRYFSAPDGYFDGAQLVNGFYMNVPDLYIKSARYPTMWVTGMMVRKDFYKKINGFNSVFHKVVTEDWEFNLRVIIQGQVSLCRRVLTRVRMHNGNQSRNSLKLSLGAATTLGFSLKNHKGNEKYKNELNKIISEFNIKSFNLAFEKGDFLVAKKLLMLDQLSIIGLKFNLKKFIINCPGFFRLIFWKISQLINR